MTEIERKALALVNEVRAEYPLVSSEVASNLALCRAIEQHEAYKQEVSDAVVNLNRYWERCEPAKEDFYARFDRFIIPKPVDPLVEALNDIKDERAGPTTESYAACLRTAMQARGYEFTKINKEQN